jgi:hypothetical protein
MGVLAGGWLQGARSKQGKMEKSFLSFAATYSSWVPEGHGKQFLAAFKSHPLQSSMLQSEFSWFWPGAPPAAAGLSGLAGHPSLGPAGRPLPGDCVLRDRTAERRLCLHLSWAVPQLCKVSISRWTVLRGGARSGTLLLLSEPVTDNRYRLTSDPQALHNPMLRCLHVICHRSCPTSSILRACSVPPALHNLMIRLWRVLYRRPCIALRRKLVWHTLYTVPPMCCQDDMVTYGFRDLVAHDWHAWDRADAEPTDWSPFSSAVAVHVLPPDPQHRRLHLCICGDGPLPSAA